MKKATHNIEKSRYEYRAKNTLALLFPDEFSGLEKSEKPDWADNMNSIGGSRVTWNGIWNSCIC